MVTSVQAGRAKSHAERNSVPRGAEGEAAGK
jgi:hypothetical protein